MKIVYIFLAFFVFSAAVFADSSSIGADCLILEDENSIICKYTHERVDVDHNVTFQWIEPTGDITRRREMTIPALHGSAYDYRYMKGRTKGIWTFKVIDEQKEYTTNFTIE